MGIERKPEEAEFDSKVAQAKIQISELVQEYGYEVVQAAMMERLNNDIRKECRDSYLENSEDAEEKLGEE